MSWKRAEIESDPKNKDLSKEEKEQLVWYKESEISTKSKY